MNNKEAERRLIISAPFGNYIGSKYAISTVGTFTLEKRPGRWRQVVRTVRHANGAWINQIGLRNPGIDWAIRKYATTSSADRIIVSVHGFAFEEWGKIRNTLYSFSRFQPIELNMSCPNVVDTIAPDQYVKIFSDYKKWFPNTIIKLPPINYKEILIAGLDSGVNNYHCCNTIPTPIGGISGPLLTSHSLRVIADIRKNYSKAVTIIGGGGILGIKDFVKYAHAGADYFAIASGWFNPFRLMRIRSLARAATHVALGEYYHTHSSTPEYSRKHELKLLWQ